MKKILIGLFFAVSFFVKPLSANAMPMPCGGDPLAGGVPGSLYSQVPALVSASHIVIGGAFGTGDLLVQPLMALYAPFQILLGDCESQTIVSAIEALAQSRQQADQATSTGAFQRSQASVRTSTLIQKSVQYGDSFVPPGTCAHDVGTSRGGGVITQAAQMAGTIHGNTDAYDNIRPTSPQALATLVSQPPSAFSATSLFGTDDLASGSTLTNQQLEQGASYINNVTHPLPLPPIPASKASTLEGKRQYLMELSDNGALSMTHHALSQVLALRAPSQANLQTWDQWMRQQTGVIPTAPQSGVSMMRLLADTVNSRFLNHGWFRTVAAYPQDKVIREIAQTEALNSELLYQILIALHNSESIQAVQLSRAVQR